MSYEQVKNLKAEDFKRLCGVRPETFTQMVEVVQTHTSAETENWETRKTQLRRPNTDDFGVLERVSYLFPYWSVLES